MITQNFKFVRSLLRKRDLLTLTFVFGFLFLITLLFTVETYNKCHNPSLSQFAHKKAEVVDFYFEMGTRDGYSSFKPKLKYRYSINGQLHTSEQLYCFGEDSFGEGSPEVFKWKDLFQKGNIIDVYVDPDNHSKSVVFKGGYVTIYIWIVINSIFIIMSVFCFRLWKKYY